MRINGIKIDNYKSFSNENNILRFDSENTIALIGKNESGKSNTLSALKDIRFFDIINTDIFENYNRINNGKVKISFDIEFLEEDIKEYSSVIKDKKSKVWFEKENGIIYMYFDGCMKDILNSDIELKELYETIKNIPINSSYEKSAKRLKNELEKYTSLYIIFDNYSLYFLMSAEIKEKFEKFKNKLEDYYDYFWKILPQILLFSNNMVIKNEYKYDDILKKNNIEGLELLLKALNFSIDDLKKWLTSTDGAEKQKYNVKFKTALDNFNKEFQNYYKSNIIELIANVEPQKIEFCIKDDLEQDGTSITNFSERSDGLKWYLSMFVQLYSARKTHKYCLILIDEPGVTLHVLAQKKLLELLCFSSNCQIIYTTHSPFMIDGNKLENIRLIVKDKYTNIVNGINNQNKYNEKSFEETLTPITNAIGMSLSENIGPSNDKMNIIVEGITDSIYINTMLRKLEIEEEKRPYIIPCIGATNERNIASILSGWGYDFKCLFDNDREGNRVANDIKKYIENPEQKIVFVSKKENSCIEDLLSNEIRTRIESKSKIISAKMFSSLIENNNIELDEETKKNFNMLFKALDIYE